MLPRSMLAVASLVTSVIAGAVPRANPSPACTNPEVRKEWRELTEDERAEYIRAAKCVRELPKAHYANFHDVVTRMDDLVYTHFALNEIIHNVANFLPWHRWFVKLHEDILRTECGFTGTHPYWDWTIDADNNDMINSPIFDPVTGFGGNGKPTGRNETGFQRCLTDGPFAYTNLTLGWGWPEFEKHSNRPHCLSRDFNAALGHDDNGDMIIGDLQVTTYNSTIMDIVYGSATFNEMGPFLEGVPHAQIHGFVHGDMSPSTSPNEPLFFLHHGNVDRVWVKWQGRNDTRLGDYAGFVFRNRTVPAALNDVMPIMELGSTLPIVKDYMDTESAALCYTYSSM